MGIKIHTKINTAGIDPAKMRLPWLLKQPAVMRGLQALAATSFAQRESAFTVLGTLDTRNIERSIAVSPVALGSLDQVRAPNAFLANGHLTGNLYYFHLLDIHAHPYETGTLSFFSPTDLEGYPYSFSQSPVMGLVQIADKSPGFRNQVELLFIKAGQGLDPSDLESLGGLSGEDVFKLYAESGLSVIRYSFPIAGLGDPSVFDNPTTYGDTHRKGVRIWPGSDAEHRLLGDLKQISPDSQMIARLISEGEASAEKKAASVTNGGTADVILLPALQRRLNGMGLFSPYQILERMGFRGSIVEDLALSFKKACDSGKIADDFSFTATYPEDISEDLLDDDSEPFNDEKEYYFKPDGKLFRSLAKFTGLAYIKDAAQLYLQFNLKAYVKRFRANPELMKFVSIAVGPDGTRFVFLMPELFVNGEFLSTEKEIKKKLEQEHKRRISKSSKGNPK